MKHCKFTGLCGAFRDLVCSALQQEVLEVARGAAGCVRTASRWCLEVENSSTLRVAFTGGVRIWGRAKESGLMRGTDQ